MKLRFASDLRVLRARLNPQGEILPIKELSEDTGISRAWLTQLERGQATYIPPQRIEALCNYFGCSPIDIFRIEEV